MKKILSLFLVLIMAQGIMAAGPRLFHISRNLNRNIIVYDLQLAGSSLNTKEPLHVYWYNQESNPVTTNELSYIQRKMAYGYSVVKASATEAVIKMKALDKRTVKICKHGGKWMAIVTINGKECQLTEVYAHCPSKTSCDYIEVRGKSLADGKSVKETIRQ